MSRSRSYCFTVNNPESDIQNPLNLSFISTYLVFQLEEGELGTPHYQGYVHLKHAMSIITLRKHLHANFIVAKGTAEQNRVYCTKLPRLEGPYEEGELPVQGKRNDCREVWNMVKAGASSYEIIESYPQSVRYYRGIDWMRSSLLTVQRSWKTHVTLYYGVSGAGKSYRALAEAGPKAYLKTPNTKWWPGYSNQENVVMDEFVAWFELTSLLRLLDFLPLKVEIKGGEVEFVARRIWMTSNVPPDQWYPNAKPQQLVALLRRIDVIQHFDTPFILPVATE